MQSVLDYAQAQKTTGFLVIRDRQVLAEANWPASADAEAFRAAFAYETTPQGALLEDVASQQKSLVGVLAAIAVDKALIQLAAPVSRYLGPGWSKASPDQESAITVDHILTMTSGLTPDFAYVAPPGAAFLYNTPVYAVIKAVLAAAAQTPLETITHDWLTAPLGMTQTAWRLRPAALGDVGNPTGLVTSPRDMAALGQMVLDGGRAANGRRVVSLAALNGLFAHSAANPAYGRLWWVNGGAYALRASDSNTPAPRQEGPLVPAAPADMVAAMGFQTRRLYIVPSRGLIVVRMGPAAPDPAFDQQLWLRLSEALAKV